MPGGDSIDQPLEELLKNRFIIGSPEDCYRQLEPLWKRFGINHLILRTQWTGMPLSTALASIRLMSRELVPELKKVRGA